MRFKKWKLPREWASYYSVKCPCCNTGKIEFSENGYCRIQVNIESKGELYIPGFYQTIRICNNPLCEWSKLAKLINT